jgi:hypothetical protein
VTVGCVFRQFPDTVSFRCVGGRTAHDWVRPVVAVLVSAGHESKRSLRHASAPGVWAENLIPSIVVMQST